MHSHRREETQVIDCSGWSNFFYTYLERELRARLFLLFPRWILKGYGTCEMVPPVTKARAQRRQFISRHLRAS